MLHSSCCFYNRTRMRNPILRLNWIDFLIPPVICIVSAKYDQTVSQNVNVRLECLELPHGLWVKAAKSQLCDISFERFDLEMLSSVKSKWSIVLKLNWNFQSDWSWPKSTSRTKGKPQKINSINQTRKKPVKPPPNSKVCVCMLIDEQSNTYSQESRQCYYSPRRPTQVVVCETKKKTLKTIFWNGVLNHPKNTCLCVVAKDVGVWYSGHIWNWRIAIEISVQFLAFIQLAHQKSTH